MDLLENDMSRGAAGGDALPFDDCVGNLRGQGYRAFRYLIAVGLSVLALGCQVASAQNGVASDSLKHAVTEEHSGKFGLSKGSFVAAPIPFRNPNIGTGLALGGGYLFNADPESDASTIALGGFRTNNGSRGYAGLLDLDLFSGRVDFEIFVGQADLNYDLYVLGVPISIEQDATIAVGDFAYGVTEDLKLGFGVRYIDTTVGLAGSGLLPDEIRPDADLSIFKAGLTAAWDTRDDTIYPTKGAYAQFDVFRGWQLEGFLDRNYDKATMLVNAYYPLTEKIVLAGRGAVCGASPEAPFFDSCAIGGTDSMRGFPVTQYIGNSLLSAQGEVRGTLTKRLGYVLFGGAGTVGDNMDEALKGPVHAAAGIGARIRLSKSYPVDFSIDGSVNDEGEKLLYIFVGQDF